MVKINISKKEIEKQIEIFFKEIKNKSPKEVKKIKRVSMSKNISLKEKRKLFCKKCFSPYSGNEKIRIKNGGKSIECKKCGKISRWKIK